MSENTEAATLWWLYLVRTADGSLYTGISTDVQRRFAEHENKDKKNKGAKALRGKAPLRLVLSLRRSSFLGLYCTWRGRAG